MTLYIIEMQSSPADGVASRPALPATTTTTDLSPRPHDVSSNKKLEQPVGRIYTAFLSSVRIVHKIVLYAFFFNWNRRLYTAIRYYYATAVLTRSTRKPYNAIVSL